MGVEDYPIDKRESPVAMSFNGCEKRETESRVYETPKGDRKPRRNPKQGDSTPRGERMAMGGVLSTFEGERKRKTRTSMRWIGSKAMHGEKSQSESRNNMKKPLFSPTGA